MYVYQSSNGRFQVAAYTSTRSREIHRAAFDAPSFETRAEAESWRRDTEARIYSGGAA